MRERRGLTQGQLAERLGLRVKDAGSEQRDLHWLPVSPKLVCAEAITRVDGGRFRKDSADCTWAQR